MQIKALSGVIASVLALAAGSALQAQSSYSTAVTGLNPAGYWPLNETTQPPAPFAQSIIATNLGTAGAAGNGYYGAWYQPSGTTWYLTNNIQHATNITYQYDGSSGLLCSLLPGQYVVVPRATNGVNNAAVTLNAPFTVEAWLQIGTQQSALGCIVSQGATVNLQTGGPNPADPYYGGPSQGWAGVEIGQYQDYVFLLAQNTNAVGTKHELDSSGYNAHKGFAIGSWVHVVGTVDASGVATLYTNGVRSASTTLPNNGAGLKFVADPSTPLMIGSGSEVSMAYGTAFDGTVADVAIYSTALSQSQVTTHYNAAFAPGYTNVVLADAPALFYRLNDAITNANGGYPSGTFPVANNLGSLGAAANGVYQPGTTPGVTGPSFSGFGANSKAVAINGFFGAVDVGGGALPAALNPTGASPLTVVSWFQGNIADAPQRFQEILGHGDTSYRLALGQVAGENHFNAGPGPEVQYTSAQDLINSGFAMNDGAWHMVAGVSDGATEYLYLDGLLALSSNNPAGVNIVGNPNDLLIGGDSQYTYAGNPAGYATVANTIHNFDGQVAQVAFWDSALSGAQIKSLYDAAHVPPRLLLSPVGSTNNQGDVVSTSAKFTGSSLTYQWYVNGTPFTSQTSSNLLLNPAIYTNSGSYYVVASNPYGAATSAVVNVQIYGPPTIISESSTNLHIITGVNETLSVVAGGPSLQYQWYSNGIAITGATASTYALNVQNPATYTVKVYNNVATNSGNSIVLTPVARPSAPYPVAVLADNPVDFYRLDEATGLSAFDLVGGNNGIYTNVDLAVCSDGSYTSGGLTANSDPSECAPEFGTLATHDSYVGQIPTNVSFSVPNGGNGEFTIEFWAWEYLDQNDSGLVAEGYGYGGEEFAIDLGAGSPATHNLRFYVNNAANANFGVQTTFAPITGWTHIAAVCDQAAGKLSLYANGQLLNSASIAPNTGIRAFTTPLSIGARQPAQGNAFTNQFIGNISQVALYNYALSSNQVLAHFDAAGVQASVAIVPNSVSTNQGANVTFQAVASGTQPITYQWYDNNGSPIGTNGPFLTLLNVQPGNAGNYSVSVNNTYGPGQASASLAVGSGPPVIQQDLSPASQTVELYSGLSTVSYTVGVSGSAPFVYKWYRDGSLAYSTTNNSGASTYSFTAAAGTHTYYVTIANSQSGGTPTQSSTVSVNGVTPAQLVPANYPHKVKITFPGYLGTPLTNFPAMISLGSSIPGFSYSGFKTTNGADLRFTDASGTSELPYEIDEWNPSGASIVWVQIPYFNGSNIWAYWGDASDTNAQAWSTDGTVWTLEDYMIVYHLKEAALPFADSTAQHPATAGNPPTPGAGVAGHAGVFTGTTYISPGKVTLSNQFTTYSWINVADNLQIQTVWANQTGGYGNNGFGLFVNSYNTDDGSIHASYGIGGGAGGEPKTGGLVVSFNTWHSLVATWNQVQPTPSVNVYLDNNSVLSANLSVAFALTNELDLGQFVAGFAAFHGSIDEARIQSGVPSPAWLASTYANVANNATFVGFAGAPTLTIVANAGGFQLSWPASGGPAQLVTATSLNQPINWTAVNITPTVVNGQNVVQVQAQPGVSHFFALAP